MDLIKIGNFIAKCRKEKNLTQQALADKLFITEKAVSKWETGKCMPSVDILKRLSEIFGVTVDELLAGELNTQKHEEILMNTLEVAEKRRNRMLQGSMLLSIAIAFCLCTIVFGREIPMVVTFGGITFSFIIAGMITLLIKYLPKSKKSNLTSKNRPVNKNKK